MYIHKPKDQWVVVLRIEIWEPDFPVLSAAIDALYNFWQLTSIMCFTFPIGVYKDTDSDVLY